MSRAPGISAVIGASPCGSRTSIPSQSTHASSATATVTAMLPGAVGAATERRCRRTARELDDEGGADDHSVSQQVRPALERQVPRDDARDPERSHEADAEVHRQHESACEQQRRAPRRLIDGAGHAAPDDATEAEAAGNDVRRLVRGVADEAEHPRREQRGGKQPQKGPERDPAGEQAAGAQAIELHRLERRAEHRVRVAPLLHPRHEGRATIAFLPQRSRRLPDPRHQNASSLSASSTSGSRSDVRSSSSRTRTSKYT